MAYDMWTISIFFVAIILAGIYYMRLTEWLKEQQSTNIEGANYTRGIATLTKAIVLIPLLFTSPAAAISAGQMLLPV